MSNNLYWVTAECAAPLAKSPLRFGALGMIGGQRRPLTRRGLFGALFPAQAGPADENANHDQTEKANDHNGRYAPTRPLIGGVEGGEGNGRWRKENQIRFRRRRTTRQVAGIFAIINENIGTWCTPT